MKQIKQFRYFRDYEESSLSKNYPSELNANELYAG